MSSCVAMTVLNIVTVTVTVTLTLAIPTAIVIPIPTCIHTNLT